MRKRCPPSCIEAAVGTTRPLSCAWAKIVHVMHSFHGNQPPCTGFRLPPRRGSGGEGHLLCARRPLPEADAAGGRQQHQAALQDPGRAQRPAVGSDVERPSPENKRRAAQCPCWPIGGHDELQREAAWHVQSPCKSASAGFTLQHNIHAAHTRASHLFAFWRLRLIFAAHASAHAHAVVHVKAMLTWLHPRMQGGHQTRAARGSSSAWTRRGVSRRPTACA